MREADSAASRRRFLKQFAGIAASVALAPNVLEALDRLAPRRLLIPAPQTLLLPAIEPISLYPGPASSAAVKSLAEAIDNYIIAKRQRFFDVLGGQPVWTA